MAIKTQPSFRPTTLISAGLVAFLIGIGLARSRIYIHGWWVALSLLSIIICWLRFERLLVVAVVLFGLLTGWWRGSVYLARLDLYNLFFHQKVTLVGRADSDAIYANNSQISFDLSYVHIRDPVEQELVGKVAIKGFGEKMVYKGNEVTVSGKLYPTMGSHQASLSFAEIQITKHGSPLVENIRRRFQAGMQSALPEPGASFGLGLLIGLRSTIPQLVSQELSAVGLTHVVAVSGYNLTIIMRGARKLLKKRSKYQSTMVALGLIGMFLLLTGLSASIVRAAMVSVLSLWAWYYGREVRPIVLILIAAALTAGIYPIYIWSDIGWYLSFLAFYGVMIIGPLVTGRLYAHKEPKLLMALVIETSAAQIMTVPIIMYIFGQFSLIAMLANVLVVPLVPLGMLLCLIAGLAGMLLPMLCGWLAWPARLLVTYMLDVVSALSRLPKASIEQPITLMQMIIMYGLVLFLVLILWHYNRGKRAIMNLKLVGDEHVRSQQMVNNQTAEGGY